MRPSRIKSKLKTEEKSSLTENLKQCLRDEAKLWYDGCVYAYRIYESQEWLSLGYASVKDYIQAELEPLGISYRLFMYRVKIGRTIEDHKIQPEDVAGIGWTKFMELTKLLMDTRIPNFTADVPALLDRARNSSLRELQDYVRKVKQNYRRDFIRRVFKCDLYEDQYDIIQHALSTAQQMSKVDADPVNLTYICMDFLVNHSTDPSEVQTLRNEALKVSAMVPDDLEEE